MQQSHRSATNPSSQSSSITSRLADLRLQSTSQSNEGTDMPAGSAASRPLPQYNHFGTFAVLGAPSVVTWRQPVVPKTNSMNESVDNQGDPKTSLPSNDLNVSSVIPPVDTSLMMDTTAPSQEPDNHHQLTMDGVVLYDPFSDLQTKSPTDHHVVNQSSSLTNSGRSSVGSNVFEGPYGSWTTNDPELLSIMRARPTSAPAGGATAANALPSSSLVTPSSSSPPALRNPPTSVTAVHRLQGAGLGPSLPVSLFPLSDHDFLSNRDSFNAVPVRRCPPPRSMADPVPHLPSVMIRVIKPLRVGAHVILLRDPCSFAPLELQCHCHQVVCQYHALCCCDDTVGECVWPDELHDPLFVPHFQ